MNIRAANITFQQINPTDFSTPYRFNAKELDSESGLFYYGARYYHPLVTKWLSVDPLADHPSQIDKSPYTAFWNNPIIFTDPDGRCVDCPDPSTAKEGDIVNPLGGWDFILTNGEWTAIGGMLGEVTVTAPRSAQGDGGGLFGDILTGTEKHFNGSVGTVGLAVQGYNNIQNDIKRAYAYKLSKMTGLKSGQILQRAKGFANGAGKWAKTLGPYGTVLGVGVIVYEVGTDTWDAHTIVNGSLMIGAGVATIFAAPAVLTGIAIYGVGDYFFDFGGTIDRNVGRNSGVWRP